MANDSGGVVRRADALRLRLPQEGAGSTSFTADSRSGGAGDAASAGASSDDRTAGSEDASCAHCLGCGEAEAGAEETGCETCSRADAGSRRQEADSIVGQSC